MKIGLISDIHARLQSLEQALTIFDEQAVDAIVCAGDLVDGGENGDAVIALLRERDIPCVQGNHDRDAFAHQAWLRRGLHSRDEDTNPFLLKSETVGFLSSLPLTRNFTLEGRSLCLAHGTPTSNTQYTFPDSPAEKFHDVIAGANADICILGHTHVPMMVAVGAAWIVNPGSVYRNRCSERRTCAILTVPEIKLDVFDVETGLPSPVITRRISSS